MDTVDLDTLGIDRVLKRGTGEVLEKQGNSLLAYDHVSGAYFLACKDPVSGLALLDQHMGPNCQLLMVSDAALGQTAFARYGFAEMLFCYQVAYLGETPALDTGLSFKIADERALPLLTETYHLVSPEDLEKIVERKDLLLGYDGEQPVGFIGEHLEGSMGLLYVFPEHRRKGYAVALERAFIVRTMEKGFIPFGQVEKENRASLALQEKVGMTRSGNLICWMWK